MKKFKIGSCRQEACAGAPAPPRWNVRSARVFSCGFRTVIGQDRHDLIFSQLPAEEGRAMAQPAPGWSDPALPKHPIERFVS